MKTTLEERKAKLEAEKAKLDARLKQLDARAKTEARKLDTRRKILVGALVLGACDVRDGNKEWLLQILRNAPDRKQDRDIIAGLIKELENKKIDTQNS